jgi:hypothetical protein
MELILMSVIIVLMFFLFSPNVVYLIHKRHFNWRSENEWGYSTPKQLRYNVNDKVLLIRTGEIYTVIETGRHDYLISNKDGENLIVYQYEIKKI